MSIDLATKGKARTLYHKVRRTKIKISSSSHLNPRTATPRFSHHSCSTKSSPTRTARGWTFRLINSISRSPASKLPTSASTRKSWSLARPLTLNRPTFPNSSWASLCSTLEPSEKRCSRAKSHSTTLCVKTKWNASIARTASCWTSYAKLSQRWRVVASRFSTPWRMSNTNATYQNSDLLANQCLDPGWSLLLKARRQTSYQR